MPSATYFTQATELKFSLMLVGWGTDTGEASSSLKALLVTFTRRQGLRHGQPRPLLERQGRRAARGGARDRRRREAREAPAARDRARDQRHGHHPAAPPGQPVGDARRHRLRAARRRAHVRVRLQGDEAIASSPRRTPGSRERSTRSGFRRDDGATPTRARIAAMTIASVPEIIAELRLGRMVILVDDEDRENEGDLIFAAEFVTPEIDQLHGDARARPDLPDAHRGALPAAQPRADGHRTTARRSARTSPCRSRRRGRDHRHLGRRPRAHDPGRRRSGRRAPTTSSSPATSSR